MTAEHITHLTGQWEGAHTRYKRWNPSGRTFLLRRSSLLCDREGTETHLAEHTCLYMLKGCGLTMEIHESAKWDMRIGVYDLHLWACGNSFSHLPVIITILFRGCVVEGFLYVKQLTLSGCWCVSMGGLSGEQLKLEAAVNPVSFTYEWVMRKWNMSADVTPGWWTWMIKKWEK